MDILNASHSDAYISVSIESIELLKFWQSHLKLLNSIDLYAHTKVSTIVFSDASDTGYAGFEVSTVDGVAH